MMPSYTVSVVIEGVDLTDEVLDSFFQEVKDAVPSAVDGAVKVTASVDAPDDQSAAFVLIDRLVAVLPDAVLVRLDQDLVSIPDIAERTSRTRESIRLLVEGKRGPGRFPTLIGSVGDGIRVWPWALVITWFQEALGEDLGEHGVCPQTAAFVDAYLCGRVRRPAAATQTGLRRPTTEARPFESKVRGGATDKLERRRATV